MQEFSSTQIALPGHLAKLLLEFGSAIPDGELAEDGRETDAHITVRFGLHTNDSEQVRQVVEDEPPVKVQLGKTDYFLAPDYDVLFVSAKSQDLKRLNALLGDSLEHTDTHAEYRPHATIAYLKSGLAERYASDDFLAGEEFEADTLFFSSKAGGLIGIPLRGKKSPMKQDRADEETDEETDATAEPQPDTEHHRLLLLWWWNPLTHRYVNRGTGRELSREEFRQTVLTAIDRAREEIADAGSRYLGGVISLAQWQVRVADTTKNLHTALAVLAWGGLAQMSEAAWGGLGAFLRSQYRYLRRFGQEVEQGEVSDAQLLARSELYAQAAWAGFQTALRAMERVGGALEEMRVLDEAAAHCGDCPPLAGFWAPIGSLPNIGETICQVNCRCEFDYRSTGDEA